MAISCRFHRHVGDLVHIINAGNGALLTYEYSDGLPIIESPELIDASSDKDLAWMLENCVQLSGRLCRPELIELGMEFGFPTMINIELLRRCSENCVHCYVGEENLKLVEESPLEKLSDYQLEQLFANLAELGVFLVAVTGGEPFVSKRLQKVLEILTAHGFLIEIFSNLQSLPQWFTDNLSEYSICRIQTSVYSSNPQVHDGITRRGGSFKRTMSSIETLAGAGLYVEVATPLMVHNFDSRRETTHLFAEMGIPHNFSWPIVNEYYSCPTGKPRLNISPSQFATFIGETPDFLIVQDFQEDVPICELGCSLLSISADGQVFPCSQFPVEVGRIIDDQNIASIYNSAEMEKFRQFKRPDAGLQSACCFCPGVNFTETGNPLQQPDYVLESIEQSKI